MNFGDQPTMFRRLGLKLLKYRLRIGQGGMRPCEKHSKGLREVASVTSSEESRLATPSTSCMSLLVTAVAHLAYKLMRTCGASLSVFAISDEDYQNLDAYVTTLHTSFKFDV